MTKTTAKASADARSLRTGMLAFARSIQVSEAAFFAIAPSNEPHERPLEVVAKGVRGQSSEDEATNAGMSNPQSVDHAAVPPDCDAVELRFSARFLPFSLRPWACDEPGVVEAHEALTAAYAASGGYRVLAERYLWNIANGRFAFRNHYQTDAPEVRLKSDRVEVAFDPLKLDFDKANGAAELAAAVVGLDAEGLTPSGHEPAAAVETLVDEIAGALAKTGPIADLDVVWRAPMKPGTEVFPSQEYLRAEEKDKNDKNGVSKVYASLPCRIGKRTARQASMHSQKIGAAIRWIDDWHGEAGHGPIPVNPYGGVQQTGRVLRDKGTGKSFYDIRKGPAKLFAAAASPEAMTGELHFFVANLVRGGVFGAKNAKTFGKAAGSAGDDKGGAAGAAPGIETEGAAA